MTGNIPGDPTPPPAGSQPASPASQGASPAPSQKSFVPPSEASGKTLTWLGMTFDPEQTKQLYKIMIQNIGNEIQKYNDKGVKAIKNFEKVSEGQDPDL